MTRLAILLLVAVSFLPEGAHAQDTITLEASGGSFMQMDDGAMGYRPADPPPAAGYPTMVVLHGAGGNAASGLAPVIAEASRRGIALVAVKSGGRSWDVFSGKSAVSGFSSSGPRRLPKGDRKRIEKALAALSDRLPVDPARTALYGFSDGASMALSLGAANPDLFPVVLAFAPGGMIAGKSGEGQRVVIAHGRADRILPFSAAANSICRTASRGGRSIRFLAHDGDHVVPRALLGTALDDFLDPASRPAGEGCPD